MARLMKSHVRVFCISFLLVFVCYWCEKNEHQHTQAFGVPSPPKDCTPHCFESQNTKGWVCCDKTYGSKASCEEVCKTKKSCC
ncbi:hypothetical protein HanXRQr2_Chr17g0795931 [Helianthus annuus]|uniref:Uncharacterized protein n=1 Tax=Helianthus annuus TaxID=4232 RepID=A0A251RN54_HELAN|nr:hypothetical protein HanXRQr2_Chr17g0795931 [Helianthus annuus]KAJ0432821.1 hypothetical protein HanIR_Chr17g0863441 [Helianthus annuus]KAJ0812587.1 hypothetical protein HanPSC8_Chr17g0763661 [Helianthus annuus]